MDADLRQLERQAAQGDLQAESQLLLTRVRAGELTEERLKLACWLGHEPARVALGERAPELPGDLLELVKGMHRWETQAAVRVAVAAARQLLPAWKSQHPSDYRPIRFVDAAEDWIACPCRTHYNHAGQLVSETERGFSEQFRCAMAPMQLLLSICAKGGNESRVVKHDLTEKEADRIAARFRSVGTGAYAEPEASAFAPFRFLVRLTSPSDSPEETLRLLKEEAGIDFEQGKKLIHVVRRKLFKFGAATYAVISTVNTEWEEEGLTPQAALAAIQAELLPWCLGTGDPVRDRVEARAKLDSP